MAPDHPVKKLHKSDILALCQKCPGLNGTDCIIADIEGSWEDYLPLPGCMDYRENRNTNEDNRNTQSPKNRNTNEENDAGTRCSGFSIPMGKTGTPCSDKIGTPQYMQLPQGKLKLTEIDIQILKLLSEKCHQRKIAKEINIPLTTVNRRIGRLEKADLIIPYQGEYATKIYRLSSRCSGLFHGCSGFSIHNEDVPQHTPFTAHSMSFKFPILEGDQPKSSKGYKTRSWTGYVFRYPDYTIRSTPRNIIIDLNKDLGASSIDDLILKYSQLAQSFVYEFAEKYHIILGGVSRYRDGHFTIEDNALAQIIAERGEICTTTGLHFDKSRSTGDLEMTEQTARSMEYTINKLPAIAAGMRSDVRDITTTVDTRLSGIEDNLDHIQKWLSLEKENRDLREQNKDLEQSLTNIAAEVKEIRALMKPGNNFGGMYG
ncbi:MAG: winged helix-turn-helix domain-containing protein [ANME-2 cluster archaeon]|nr:winged helix-turn-helix domain-containing protein [ANME-2 cluster archaeon]